MKQSYPSSGEVRSPFLSRGLIYLDSSLVDLLNAGEEADDLQTGVLQECLQQDGYSCKPVENALTLVALEASATAHTLPRVFLSPASGIVDHQTEEIAQVLRALGVPFSVILVG